MRTPVVLLTFNRPDLTRQVLLALRAARPPALFVSSDGPRASRPAEPALVADVRRLIEELVDWPCEVVRDYVDDNQGCGRRVSTALTRAFERFPEAIVLEDDCLPMPSFFMYCEDVLERYRHDGRVMHVGAVNLWRGAYTPTSSYVFTRYPLVGWGWASWRRAWSHYDYDMRRWPEIRARGLLGSRFGDAEQAAYWTDFFDRAHADPRAIDTWDHQWFLACLANDGLCIEPRTTLVTNLGFRGDATHTTAASDANLATPAVELQRPLDHPPEVVHDGAADRALFEQFFRRSPPRPGLVRRALDRVRRRAHRSRGADRVPPRVNGPVCPLSGSSDVELRRTFETARLVERWRAELGIDVAARFGAVSELQLFHSRPMDLSFFRPVVRDDPGLYAELQRHPWYYQAEKWEHDLALAELVRALPAGARLLELGCGTGAFLARCRDAGLRPIGIDENELAAAEARKQGLDVRAEARLPPADMGSFEAVVAFQVLEHVSEPRAFLADAIALLRPGGLLFLAVPDQAGFVGWSEPLLNLPPHHQTRWTERTLRALARVFPIDVVRTWHEPLSPIHFESYLEGRARRLEAVLGPAAGRLMASRLALGLGRRFLRNGGRHLVRGHTVCALLRRRVAPSGSWRASCGS